MARREQDRIIVDGGSLDLEAGWGTGQPGTGVLGFLTQHAPKNPWFVGIAAIVGIVVFADAGQSPWVLGGAIFSVALITIVSTWKRDENEHERETELGRFAENANTTGEPSRTTRQWISGGSDPPVG